MPRIVPKAKPKNARPNANPRYSIRLTPDEARRLLRMSRWEKRSIAELVRENLDQALTQWEATHPRNDV